MNYKNLNLLVFLIYLISSSESYSIERPDINNLIIHQEKKMIGKIEFFNSKNLTERGFSPKYVSIMTENYINLDAGDSQQEREFITKPLVEKKSTLGQVLTTYNPRRIMTQVPNIPPVINTREISTEE